MENDSVRRRNEKILDTVIYLVLKCIDDFELKDLISQTCKRWKKIESEEREHVTMALSCTSTPEKLEKRFPKLKSLKLKGKPRAARFDLIPENWGGYAAPWINMIENYDPCLNSLHLKRMIVSDHDLSILAKRSESLFSLKLENCSGFTTNGLKHICRFCTNLRVLFMEESLVIEHDGDWLHELALHNKVLETLNFNKTGLYITRAVNIKDLELLAKNCPNLVSVKITDCEIFDLNNFFRLASSLEEFCGGIYNKNPEEYGAVILPAKLSQLGLRDITEEQLPFMFPPHATQLTTQLKKLDIFDACLETADDHITLIQRCPNLEILVSKDAIGDKGLEELGRYCKKLKRLRIKRDVDLVSLDSVSQTGLISISQGCSDLEYISVEVTNVTNDALEQIGIHLKKLCDFRLLLLDNDRVVRDLPLDNGVRRLLEGCEKMRRFALYLKPGWLTDVGLGYIGQHSANVKWMLLGDLGLTDIGLLQFSNGCPSLKKLEIRGSPFFTESALAIAARRLQSLRYLWVQGYRARPSGLTSLAKARDCWNTELIPSRQEDVNDQFIKQNDQILCYHSLVQPRADIPGGSWCAMVLNC